MQIERHSSRRPSRGGAGAIARFLVALVAVVALSLAGLAIAVALRGRAVAGDLGPAAGHLSPLERAALSAYLALNADALKTPVASEGQAVAFVVSPGENADTVSARLAQAGLVSDATLLRMYMRYKGSDSRIEAGNFLLSPAMTIPAVADALTSATPDEVTVRVWEGWRAEQVAESLAAAPHLAVDPQAFLKLIGPGGRRTGGYSFLGDIPATASLEGFLFPDTYRFQPGAAASEVLDRLLSEFDAKVTPQMRSDAAGAGLTVFQVVTLASIVEREAVHDEERALIAGVFLNRLKIGMKLDADPTTQYAIAGPRNWWPPLNLDPRTVEHPYNTYVHGGLPPGPIANPGRNSILAVIYPAQTDFLYFRAKCDGSKYHNFSTTYEEHVGYGCP